MIIFRRDGDIIFRGEIIKEKMIDIDTAEGVIAESVENITSISIMNIFDDSSIDSAAADIKNDKFIIRRGGRLRDMINSGGSRFG